MVSLIAISITSSNLAFAVYSAMLVVLAAGTRISLGKLLGKAWAMLAFLLALALVVFLSGEPARAIIFLERSTLSAIAAMLFIAATPVNDLIRALDWFRVPNPLLLTIQFLYRYLFVISNQARQMRFAAASRGGFRFRSAAGAIAVLFMRSWQRADGIYSAMLARGFTGKFLQ